MAFVRVKRVGSKSYKYLVAGKRVEGVVKQKVLKYLGPVDPVYKVGVRKTNSSIYARELSEGEVGELNKEVKGQNSFRKDRARIILLSASRMSCLEVAGKLGCDVRKARLAVKSFNEKGISFLVRGRGPGAKIKFGKETKEKILAHFSLNPSEFGYCYTVWTLPRFRKHLLEQGVVESISIETLRQILMKGGAKLRRSKRWQYSPDKEFPKKNKR